MKKIIITLLIVLFICGCNSEETNTGLEEQDSSELSPSSQSSSAISPKMQNLFDKYRYDCSYSVDHATFNYDMQQAMIERCWDSCCGGSYCDKCVWQASECYQECDDNKPDGYCVNCDGYCWEMGHEEFLKNKIANC